MTDTELREAVADAIALRRTGLPHASDAIGIVAKEMRERCAAAIEAEAAKLKGSGEYQDCRLYVEEELAPLLRAMPLPGEKGQ